ncbi:MAG: hypothetical protein ACI9LM_004572 [Alteromonadaceae bacterium]|jgi:hypothetical protein
MTFNMNEDSGSRKSENYDKDFSDKEQTERNNKARKRIDELKEKKRLKELLDESDDWEL